MNCYVCGEPMSDQRFWINHQTGHHYHLGCVSYNADTDTWTVPDPVYLTQVSKEKKIRQ